MDECCVVNSGRGVSRLSEGGHRERNDQRGHARHVGQANDRVRVLCHMMSCMLHGTMSATHAVEPAMVSWQLMHLTHGATHCLGCTSGYCSRLLHRSKSDPGLQLLLDVRSHSAAKQGQHHGSDIALTRGLMRCLLALIS